MNSIRPAPPHNSPPSLGSAEAARTRDARSKARELDWPHGPVPWNAFAYTLEPRVLPLCVVPGKVPAGFPSPAEDFAVKRHDLNELLITHAMATFLWRVSGQSMTEAGIFDGDILVVNRALVPVHKDVVVAEVDGEFTVKYFYKRNGNIKLQPANPTYPEITFKEGQSLRICGVVTSSIKRFRKSAQNLD
jgi:DNA polymerase V